MSCNSYQQRLFNSSGWSGSQIKVFEFKQGMLKLIQCLSEHPSGVNTLHFMKKSIQFISGSDDASIIIWQKDQNNQWISQQKLNGHSKHIYCLILNNNEDLIISGNSDKSIKFWMKNNEWLCQQTITDHSNQVFGLSLNQQQNRLVSCGCDNMILIIKQSEQKLEWIVIQKIKVEQYGFRVCFIDNMFTFSPYNREQMSVFEMNQQITKIKDITLQCGSDGWCLFPQQYINSKCILVSKNGEYVNLIRNKQNGELLTQQSIHFGTFTLFGTMSDDGEYLITRDFSQNKYKQEDIKNNEIYLYNVIIQYIINKNFYYNCQDFKFIFNELILIDKQAQFFPDLIDRNRNKNQFVKNTIINLIKTQNQLNQYSQMVNLKLNLKQNEYFIKIEISNTNYYVQQKFLIQQILYLLLILDCSLLIILIYNYKYLHYFQGSFDEIIQTNYIIKN